MLHQRRWITIHDYLTFKPLEVEANKRFLWETRDEQSETGHSLLVKVAATHSGIVTGNRKFYRPDFMQASAHSWVPAGLPPLPVLRGHDSEGDVLGRVREARYVDDSWKYKNAFPSLTESVFYNQDSRSKRVDIFKTIDLIQDRISKLKDYQGLGHIELGLSLTNPEAIQKVLRDEYLCVSAGAITDQAICSACHTDWASDDKCDHTPGEIVDGRMMFLISGRFKYKEISFVNFGADPFAQVKSRELKDSLEKMFFMGLPMSDQQAAIDQGLTISDSLYESDLQIAYEDQTMSFDVNAAKQTLEDAALTAERAFQLQAELAAWEPVEDAEKTSKRSLRSSLTAKIRKNGWKQEAAASADTSDVVADGEMAAVEQVADAEVAAAVEEVQQVEDKVAPIAETAEIKTNTVALSDELKALVEPIELHDADASCEICARLLSGTAKAQALYQSADDTHRSKMTSLGRALLELFSAENCLNWAKEYVQNHDSENVLVTKADLSDKEDALNGLNDEVTSLKDSAAAADRKVATFFLDSKRSLATSLVMHKVLTKQTGFVGLSPAQVQDKIAELSKRHVQSLKDAVNDLFTELQFNTAAEPAKTGDDQGVQVDDNAHVDESAATLTPTEIKDKQAHDARLLQRHLRYMSDPMERARFTAAVKAGTIKLS